MIAANVIFRRYELGYGAPSSDSGRSLLRQVDIHGLGGGPELPRSAFFSYHSNVEAGTQGWVESTGTEWKAIPYFTDATDFADNGVRIADVNGDALPDIVRGTRDDGQPMDATSGVYFNTGSDFAPFDPNWSFPSVPDGGGEAAFVVGGKSLGSVLADFDGDGRADLLVAQRLVSGGNAMLLRWRELLYRNDGSGWTELLHDDSNMAGVQIPWASTGFDDIARHDTSFSTWAHDGMDWAASTGFSRLADLDGDGTPDLWSHFNDWGWALRYPPGTPRLTHIFNHAYRLFDRGSASFGPALDDRFHVTECPPGDDADCDFRAGVSGQDGFHPTADGGIRIGAPVGMGKRLVDLNGDGLADYIYALTLNYGGTERQVNLNEGHDFVLHQDWTLPTDVDTQPPNGLVWDNGVRFVDVNGDGRVDAVRATLEAETGGYGVWLNTGNPAAPWSDQGTVSAWNVPDADQADGMAFVGTE